MSTRFTQFAKEKKFLLGVSERTVEWYESSLKWLPNENPTTEELKQMVVAMREHKLKPSGINCCLRAINSYLHWNSGAEGKCTPMCKHPRVSRLKEPQLQLPTFTNEQVKHLIHYRPKTKGQRRLHLLVLFMLDTGCRISEALTLRVSSIDFENLLVALMGKGGKERKVPFSFELRRAMFKYVSDFNRKPEMLLLASRNEVQLGRRDTLRDVKQLCRGLGFEPPIRTLHSFRHSFAVNYLRRGGSVFHLQKCLGHSSLEMTKRYANLLTEDLQAVHPKVSLLAQL